MINILQGRSNKCYNSQPYFLSPWSSHIFFPSTSLFRRACPVFFFSFPAPSHLPSILIGLEDVTLNRYYSDSSPLPLFDSGLWNEGQFSPNPTSGPLWWRGIRCCSFRLRTVSFCIHCNSYESGCFSLAVFSGGLGRFFQLPFEWSGRLVSAWRCSVLSQVKYRFR